MNAPDASLPGHDLVKQGINDLAGGRVTDCALLVQIAGPRLRSLGIAVPPWRSSRPCEHQLYERLEERLGPGAHSYYNGLLRRINSFAHALEREHGRQGQAWKSTATDYLVEAPQRQAP